MDRGTLNRDGFELTWVREGSGVPMIVVGSPTYYRRAFPQALREHFELVFCDSRQWVVTPDGFDVAQLTLRSWTDDIEAVRGAAGLDRPIVIGQSQHGCLALAYGSHYPASARGVAAVASPPPYADLAGQESSQWFFERDADPARKQAHEHNLATLPTHVDASTAATFIDNYVANAAMTWYDPTFDCRSTWEGIEVINLEVMSRLFETEVLGTWSLNSDLPSLLVLGRFDYSVPYYLWDEPAKRMSRLTCHYYDQSGHQPQFEEPARFTADIVEWAKTL